MNPFSCFPEFRFAKEVDVVDKFVFRYASAALVDEFATLFASAGETGFAVEFALWLAGAGLIALKLWFDLASVLDLY